MSDDDLTEILSHMVSTGILSEDQDLLWLGRQGEDQYGFRYFMELFSVFTSDPLFSVRYGQEILGECDGGWGIARRLGKCWGKGLGTLLSSSRGPAGPRRFHPL